MSKFIVTLTFFILLGYIFAQQKTISGLELTLARQRDDYWATQKKWAGAEGALFGLYIATDRTAERLAEYRRLIEIKDHTIESLQKGHVLTITAYNAEVGQTDDSPFITASNTRVRPGIIAVSQDLYAKGWVFGRKVYVVNRGVYTIEDLLAKRKKNQLDIFMNSRSEAIKFGRRKMRVFLLGG